MGWTPLDGIDVPKWRCRETATEEASVGKISMIGIDLAKHVFQLYGSAADGTVLFAASMDGDDTVFGLHVDDDLMENVLVLIEHLGDTGEGEDVGDGGHAQAALAVAGC